MNTIAAKKSLDTGNYIYYCMISDIKSRLKTLAKLIIAFVLRNLYAFSKGFFYGVILTTVCIPGNGSFSGIQRNHPR